MTESPCNRGGRAETIPLCLASSPVAHKHDHVAPGQSRHRNKIWNIASAKFPEATQVVDLFHAREHLHDLARSLEFMLGDQPESWLAARLEDLDYGDIDGL